MRALRAPPGADADDFVLVCRGVSIRVQYFSGSSSHVVLSNRFMGMRGTSSAPTVRGWAAFFTFLMRVEATVAVAHVVGAVLAR